MSATRVPEQLAIVVFGWMASILATAVPAQSDEVTAIRQKLIGSWHLISWEERSGDKVSYPLGPNAVGQIVYTDDGRMSAQLMRNGMQRFASEDWRNATTQEKSRAWSGYFGYFGTYSIDLQRRAVVHHIEGSWFPNLLGTDQIRRFRFEGERLVLDADTQWGQVHIVWERSRRAGKADRADMATPSYSRSVSSSIASGRGNFRTPVQDAERQPRAAVLLVGDQEN